MDSLKRRKHSLSSRHPRRVAIIEPVWTHYRYPVYRELAQACQVDWLFSPVEREIGFGTVIPAGTSSMRYVTLPMRNLFGQVPGFWQSGVTRYLVRERPDVVMCSANPRSASFWLALVVGRVLGIPVYAHGHGVYGKKKISGPYRRLINQLLRLSAGYVAYAPIVRDAFAHHGFSVDKVGVAHNSIVNPCLVRPAEKTGTERGVLFVGRMRPDSGIEILLQAVQRLRQGGYQMELHAIGDGKDLLRLQTKYSGHEWVHWHGEQYDPGQIREISRACFAGCYPGSAGLSVVQMMSLSLPVIVQDGFERHGPEVALVRDGENGIRCPSIQLGTHFDEALRAISQDPSKLQAMQEAAYRTYVELTTPSLATQLGQIFFQTASRPTAIEIHGAASSQLAPAPMRATDVAGK